MYLTKFKEQVELKDHTVAIKYCAFCETALFPSSSVLWKDLRFCWCPECRSAILHHQVAPHYTTFCMRCHWPHIDRIPQFPEDLFAHLSAADNTEIGGIFSKESAEASILQRECCLSCNRDGHSLLSCQLIGPSWRHYQPIISGYTGGINKAMLEKFDDLKIVNDDLQHPPKTIKEVAEHLRAFDLDVKSSFDFIVTWRDRFTVHVLSTFSTCALYQIDSKGSVDRSQPILFSAAAATRDLLEAITTIAEAMCYSAIGNPSQVKQSTLDDKVGRDMNAVKTYLLKYARVYQSCFEVLRQKIKDLEKDPDWTELETKLLTTMVNAHEINIVFDHECLTFKAQTCIIHRLQFKYGISWV